MQSDVLPPVTEKWPDLNDEEIIAAKKMLDSMPRSSTKISYMRLKAMQRLRALERRSKKKQKGV